MDIIVQVKDRDIPRVIDPSGCLGRGLCALLKAKKNFIREIPMKSFKYGELDRHHLDIYYPLTSSSAKTPILFFVYGGGFDTGERSISPKTFGLVYACLAAFFARRGYIIVIPDYRLVPNVEFPGPAEDVRDAVRWVVNNAHELVSSGSPVPNLDHIVLMGHSAGAVHVSTMLFCPNVLPADDPLRPKIVAAILESPPFDLSAMTMEWPSAPTHAKYWGTLESAKANDPLHLYRRLPNEAVERLPKVLMVEGEFEPDFLIDAGDVFRKEVKERTGVQPKKIIAKGHNHISLNWALSTGEGEEWAERTVEWLKELKD
ncbi:hypothetical protein NLJ89_g1016 [Agrocybe chaxingu]|uniref:BD-FAE-like domain-containing protein n=1 Tax=Agrocybe chaxingu TaxID=84603 RepID=A0A9W8N0S3_9AGAR|nr:hypothetical protein NLJ89_g1016 [Agrocybe chaxingu]